VSVERISEPEADDNGAEDNDADETAE